MGLGLESTVNADDDCLRPTSVDIVRKAPFSPFQRAADRGPFKRSAWPSPAGQIHASPPLSIARPSEGAPWPQDVPVLVRATGCVARL